jgi:hypothetical protein
MNDIKAQAFADALTELCKKHGVMIWTATAAERIMATSIPHDEPFYYLVDPYPAGNATVIIHRVLGDKP